MSQPKIRVCHVQKREDFQGYGFNLYTGKEKPGQYIGKIDEGSPAETAGIIEGYRILEVNGESIINKTHKQVVELIRAESGGARLLIIDPAEDQVVPIDADKNSGGQNDNSNNGKDQDNAQLNLNMTAVEFRAKLAARKKFDPKKEDLDFKQKFEILQKL